jgi:hypothetical protein
MASALQGRLEYYMSAWISVVLGETEEEKDVGVGLKSKD